MIPDLYAQAVDLVWYEVRFSATESSPPITESRVLPLPHLEPGGSIYPAINDSVAAELCSEVFSRRGNRSVKNPDSILPEVNIIRNFRTKFPAISLSIPSYLCVSRRASSLLPQHSR